MFRYIIFLVLIGSNIDGFSTLAQEMQRELVERTLPYWFDTAQDLRYGGYLLRDDEIAGRTLPLEKQLVTQSRMIWTFSHVALRGVNDASRNYLAAARQGYQFLLKHFLDRASGGYFWMTTRKGKVINRAKFLYGQGFVIYALAEYYRATQDRSALTHALELYRVIQAHLYDDLNGGWFEQADRDWKVFPPEDPRNLFHLSGCKSANTHLHWMEALTELYDVSRDEAVKESLIEVLDLNKTYFWPEIPGHHIPWRQYDWAPIFSGSISYGHNVEFAWLMIRAERVLGQAPSWNRFYSLLNHTLEYGWDKERGGVYKEGYEDLPATDTEKVWWVQAEMLAALTEALKHRADSRHEQALGQLLHFIKTYQMSPRDGIWLTSVTAEGKLLKTSKADHWKANYHDVRAMMKFVEEFLFEDMVLK